jgi:hypothetical protein
MSSEVAGDPSAHNPAELERRNEPRILADLPVRIRAVNQHGGCYSQQVVARNVSSGGALLVGLEMELQSGDLVLLQYGAQRARYRIVWTRDSEGPRRILAAVQRLEEDYCPWQDLLTPPVRPG